LFDDLTEDFNIFIELSASRQWDSMAGLPQPLRFSELEAYMRLQRIENPLQQQRLLKRLQFMDQTYCNYYRENHGGHTDNSKRSGRDKARRDT
jgi:hypothetical protein